MSVVLFSLAAVLVVLALLAGQLTDGASSAATPRQIVIRRIYSTTVVETGSGVGGTSVSQSTSSSSSGPSASAPAVTGSSH